MSKSRKSSRLARKGGAFRHTIHDDVKEEEECIQLGQNGKPIDEIDILMEKTKSKFPICPTLNKRINQHNIADLPSLNDELDNPETVSSQSNSEAPDIIQRKARAKANNLIEAKNRFRSLLQKTHSKNNPELQAQYELEKKASGEKAPEAPRTRLQAQSSIKATGPSTKKQSVLFRIGGPKRINFTPLLPRADDTRPDDETTANFHRALAQLGYSRYCLIPELKPKKRQEAPEIDNDPDGPYSSEPLDIWHLPPPEPDVIDPKTGKCVNLLIPKRIREFERKSLDIVADIDSMDDKPTDRLRNEYKAYFEASAQEFRDAYKEENSRFRHAFKVLDSMFE